MMLVPRAIFSRSLHHSLASPPRDQGAPSHRNLNHMAQEHYYLNVTRANNGVDSLVVLYVPAVLSVLCSLHYS